MNTTSGVLYKFISIVLTSVVLLVPLFTQPCSMISVADQQPDKPSGCDCGCCSNSNVSSSTGCDNQHNCPCQMKEKQAEEYPPAVLISHQDTKPEIYPVLSEIELFDNDPFIQQKLFYTQTYFLPSRDHPLYIINSSFLI